MRLEFRRRNANLWQFRRDFVLTRRAGREGVFSEYGDTTCRVPHNPMTRVTGYA